MSTHNPEMHRLYAQALERIRAAHDLHEAKRLAATALVTIPYREPAPAATPPSGQPCAAQVNLLLYRLRDAHGRRGHDERAGTFGSLLAEVIAEIERLHRLPGGALHRPSTSP